MPTLDNISSVDMLECLITKDLTPRVLHYQRRLSEYLWVLVRVYQSLLAYVHHRLVGTVIDALPCRGLCHFDRLVVETFWYQ